MGENTKGQKYHYIQYHYIQYLLYKNTNLQMSNV